MKAKNLLIYLFLITLISCNTRLKLVKYENNLVISKKIADTKLKNWESLDLQSDSIVGISLSRIHNEIIKKRKSSEIIIAVLDTEIDISHEAIKPYIWKNIKEIANNGIDDDKNGYVDDVNGWNFLGNISNKSVIRNNYECSRIINYFKVNQPKNRQDSILLEKAKKLQEQLDKEFLTEKERIDFYKSVFPNCYKTIRTFFPTGKYSTKQIDSLYAKYKENKEKLGDEIYFLNELKKYDLDSAWVSNNIKTFDLDAETIYNKNYDEKSITKDDPYNFKDSIYGNNNISVNAKQAWHSTQVSGLIAKLLSQNKNIKFKIMPVVMVAPKGEENDKDVATAIHYAVNNGAKIINVSFGKDISRNKDLVKEAILYAEKHDVLIIAGSGNDGKDLDTVKTFYPIDYDEITRKEFCNNFIKVGGITPYLLGGKSYENSNYGKKNVDIFAPATELYVPDATKSYTFNQGTSLATAITSGVAALVRSYYQKLTASQVKQILLDSSVKFNLDVQVPGEKEGTLKPFSELSKSGGVINAYNALLMAKEINKKEIK